MTFLNELLTGIQINDEIIAVNNSSIAQLAHDTIMSTSFEIWTAANKTGTKLVLNTDYTLADEDPCLTGEAGVTIFTKFAIINPAYFGIGLYYSYKTIGDYNDAGDINALRTDLTNAQGNISTLQSTVLYNSATQTITANYNVLSTDKKILVNTNTAINLSITPALPIGFELGIQRIASGLTSNGVNLVFTGETLNGAGSFIIFGNTVAKSVKYAEIFTIRKITATEWTLISGEDSGANSRGYYTKKYDRSLKVKYPVTYETSVANVATDLNLPTMPTSANYEIPITVGVTPANSANANYAAWYQGGQGFYQTDTAGNYLTFSFDDRWF